MTGAIQIPLSRVGSADAFAAAVESYRADLADHRTGAEGQPAPIAHELIDSLILRIPQAGPVESRGADRFEIAPYEIVDDTPPPPAPPTLADRKRALLLELHTTAQAAIDKVLSPARARLLALDYNAAISVPKSKRNARQKAAVAKFETYNAGAGVIQHAVALAAVTIEDLTETTINDWTVPTFD